MIFVLSNPTRSCLLQQYILDYIQFLAATDTPPIFAYDIHSASASNASAWLIFLDP